MGLKTKISLHHLSLVILNKRTMLPFTVIEVEAMTVRRALILALEIGFDRVILEGDSKVFITALQNSSYTLSHFGHIVKNIQYLAFYFLEIYYSHLRRYSFFSKTSNFYFSWSLDQVWIEDVSPNVISILTLKKKKRMLSLYYRLILTAYFNDMYYLSSQK